MVMMALISPFGQLFLDFACFWGGGGGVAPAEAFDRPTHVQRPSTLISVPPFPGSIPPLRLLWSVGLRRRVSSFRHLLPP
jgi:hypothetical protein